MSNIQILRINGDLYAGETKDGKPHGKGVLKYYVFIKLREQIRQKREGFSAC